MHHLPITALQKLLMQCLFSKIRPQIALQPLRQSQAFSLQQRLFSIIHDYFGFPFSPGLDILLLPIQNHGFGFPSIVRLNLSLALSGLLCDLNHHLPIFATMARITLADWKCTINRCIFPLAGDGLRIHHSPSHPHLPHAFVVAHSILLDLSLHIHPTDQSHIRSGNITLPHIAAQTRPNFPTPSLHTLLMFCRENFAFLRQWGSWSDSPNSVSCFSPFPSNPSPPGSTPHSHWPAVVRWLRNLPISLLSVGDFLLTFDRSHRRQQAFHHILSSSSLTSFARPGASFISPDNHLLWASDGSACPDSPSVIASVFGPSSVAFHFNASSHNIIHAEIFGLILAAILAISQNSPLPVRILTDHLNSVRLLQDARFFPLPSHFWNAVSGRAFYQWLIHLLRQLPVDSIDIVHIKAHTDLSDTPSLMNCAADHIAVSPHLHPAYTPVAPEPTFDMDEFALWSSSKGYIDSNLSLLSDDLLIACTMSSFAHDLSLCMPSPLYHHHHPPSYPYERAYSAYSALVQLYARSGQLPSNLLLCSRNLSPTSKCCFGCTCSEDDHHIFVVCPHFRNLHDIATRCKWEINQIIPDYSPLLGV